jgi:chromosomal replication initiator protein
MPCKQCAHCRAELLRRHQVDQGILLPRIASAAALIVSVDERDLFAKTRGGLDVAWARAIAYYLARQLTNFSFPQIGRLFGRDHSTVIHGYQTVRDRIEVHRDDALTVAKVRARALRGLSKKWLEPTHKAA